MLALVLQSLVGDSARIDAALEARILNPYDCVSADGGLRLHVEPSEREGRGPSTVFLLRDGQLAWIEDVPFTFRDAVVDRGGTVLGRAGDDHLWIRGAEERAFRELAPPYTTSPTAMVVGLIDVAWENSALIRVREVNSDVTSSGRAERWWRFDFARGQWASTVTPEGEIAVGFELLLVDGDLHALVGTERGPMDSVWARALDTRGCTKGLQILGGIGFDPVELRASRIPVCGNLLRVENAWLSDLVRERAWGLDLRPRLKSLLSLRQDDSCTWPRVRLQTLGTETAPRREADKPVSVPASAQRRIDGSWINEVVASTSLIDGGFAVVDFPMEHRGERFARLVLTDANGAPIEQHVLPFRGAAQVTAYREWIVVVPIGRASVAMLNRRTGERFEVLTRTFGRAARAGLSADAAELAVVDEERGTLERFRLSPR